MTAIIELLGGIRATIFAGLAALLLVACGVQSYRLNTAQKAIAIVASKAAEAETARANAETKASEAARSEEHSRAQAANVASNAYEKGKRDAQAAADGVIAGLRDGSMRLRAQWRGCENRLPGPAASPGELVAAADLRATGAGDLVRVVDTCEAQVLGLQAVTEADRRKVGKP